MAKKVAAAGVTAAGGKKRKPSKEGNKSSKKKAKDDDDKSSSSDDRSQGMKEKPKLAAGANVRKNYLPVEDLCITKAFTNVTTDPINGNNQKAEVFWKKVYEKFQLFLKEPDMNLPNDYDCKTWGWHSVRDRFQKKIAKLSMKFNGHLKCIYDKNESGKTDEDKWNDAMDLYFQSEGKTFPFRECLVCLHDIPKYNPFTATEDNPLELSDDEDEEGGGGKHNEVSKMQGSGMKRPMGSKKAKALAKKGKASVKSSLTSTADTTAGAIGRLVASSNDLVGVLERKQNFDELKQLAQMSIALGDMEQAAYYNEKMAFLHSQENLRKEGRKKKAAATVPKEIAVEEEAKEEEDKTEQESEEETKKAKTLVQKEIALEEEEKEEDDETEGDGDNSSGFPISLEFV